MWTPDDFPLGRVDSVTDSSSPLAKVFRPVCALCKYEGRVIRMLLEGEGRGVSIPFIIVYFRPAIAFEVLSFVANRIADIFVSNIELENLYGDEENGIASGKGLPGCVLVNHLGAFVVVNYAAFSRDIRARVDFSGNKDSIYYGLTLIPKLAWTAGGGQFRIGVTVMDLLTPPVKIVEAPTCPASIEALNYLALRLREEAKRGRLRREYAKSYYYLMRGLEGLALRAAYWYSRRVGERGWTATWIVKSVEDLEGVYLPVSLVSPPPSGFERRRGGVFEFYTRVFELARELEDYLSRVGEVLGGDGMSPGLKPLNYEEKYVAAIIKVVGRRFGVSQHVVTGPLWEALSHALMYYGTYDNESLVAHAVNTAKDKLRKSRTFIGGRKKEEAIDELGGSVEGLVRFVIHFAEKYPRQKAWELARKIRRSVYELYLSEVSRREEGSKGEKGEE